MEIMSKSGRQKLIFDEKTLGFALEWEDESWEWDGGFRPRLLVGDREIFFAEAGKKEHREIHNGVGDGILSRYSGFCVDGVEIGLEFETYVWMEASCGDVYFEWIPVREEGTVTKVFWPGPMAFDEKRRDWYTLVPERQGLLIPNDWPVEFGRRPFGGMLLTADMYMPWFSQIRENSGYIAIAVTPWNGSLVVDHPARGPYTHASMTWEPSLGRMDYRRILRYSFRRSCDYNEMCKIYRSYVFERGLAATLAEKAARLPSVDRLVGSAFVHKGIKTSVNPKSDFFDPKDPEKNNSLTRFSKRQQEAEEYAKAGVKRVYLHLDGWAEPGYDNCHPDYLPACEAAGGWEGMRALAEAYHRHGYLFGIHDQYRDYYHEAPSYQEEYACHGADGSVPGHSHWAGGPQSYLCGSQAPYYVKRNFSKLRDQGVKLDGAYLDVFTCNEGDECASPEHRMTRRDCYAYRKQCFDYLISRGILPSSEEAADWSMGSLVFCHYAPYSFMLEQPGHPRKGMGLPLFNLVYHDCLIEPWMMESFPEGEDYMLYALLNGGAPYLERDGAYPNVDGAFTGDRAFTLEEKAARCAVVSGLHERVAKLEMTRHSFLSEDGRVQRSEFADGTRVTVDLGRGTYEIQYGADPQTLE